MDTSYDGGGWTLVAVSSSDLGATWTWNGRALWDTDTTTFGSLSNLSGDFKSAAMHDVAMTDLLFLHSTPSTPLTPAWAGYNGVGDGVSSFAEFMGTYSDSTCYTCSSASTCSGGYLMTAGTISAGGDLCSTDLFFNAKDHDGPLATCKDDNNAHGPSWSTNNGEGGAWEDGCPFDDPGKRGSLGPDKYYPGDERDALGFGYALGLNTGTAGAGVNNIQVLVRE
jgi:hypothetical protein